MPDKDVWLAEVNRVLTPGGTFLCASWCRRESDKTPLSGAEQRLLGRICKNYSLPEIVPLSTYRQASARLGFEVTATSTSFLGRSPAHFPAHPAPRTRRVLCSKWCPS